MNKPLIKTILLNSFALIVFSFYTSTILAQGVKINNQEGPHFYLSAAYVSSYNYNHVTSDPYYTRSFGIQSNKTVRADFGLQINRRISIEAGYIRMPLEVKHELLIGRQQISNGSRSNSRISFYSMRLNHGLSIWKNRILFKTGLGYALGNSTASFREFGPSIPKTSTSFGHVITTSTSSKRLRNGNNHFLTMNAGIELVLDKKVSIFANYSVYKGFSDYEEMTLDYNINGEKGIFTTTADGSFMGYELGLKFNFR